MNGVAVRTIVSHNDTMIIVVAQISSVASSLSEVRIIVNTGAIITFIGWRYVAPASSLVVSPTFGQYGTVVSISGFNLLGGALPSDPITVKLAGVSVFNISYSSDILILVVAGVSGATSNGSVEIITLTGSMVTILTSFQYLTLGVINTVLPASGQTGSLVTISGTNMLSGGATIRTVILAGVSTSAIVFADNSVIMAIASRSPTSTITSGVVIIANTGALITSDNRWAYLVPGRINIVSPDSGQVGTRVSITGIEFFSGGSNVASVTLSGVNAAIILASNTQINCYVGSKLDLCRTWSNCRI